jgi:hypothetical protein
MSDFLKTMRGGLADTPLIAEMLADIDRAQAGENCNPYSEKKQELLFKAYNARYEQICAEWAEFTGSAA